MKWLLGNIEQHKVWYRRRVNEDPGEGWVRIHMPGGVYRFEIEAVNEARRAKALKAKRASILNQYISF